MTARLGRYAARQAADFLRDRGVALAIILTMLTLGVWADPELRGSLLEPGAAPRLRGIVESLMTALATPLVVVAFTGLVSADRQAGFTRFLFARPVDVRAFYGQKWLLAAVLLLAMLAAWLGVMALLFQPFDPRGALLGAAMRVLVYGGLLFLWSVFRANEFLWFGGTLAVAGLAETWAAKSPVASAVVEWLAPWTRLPAIDGALRLGTTPPLADVLVVAVGGLVCLGAGLAGLRASRLVP